MSRQVSRFFPTATGPPRPIVRPLDCWTFVHADSSPYGHGKVDDKVEKKVGNNINNVGYSMKHINNNQIKDKNINANIKPTSHNHNNYINANHNNINHNNINHNNINHNNDLTSLELAFLSTLHYHYPQYQVQLKPQPHHPLYPPSSFPATSTTLPISQNRYYTNNSITSNEAEFLSTHPELLVSNNANEDNEQQWETTSLHSNEAAFLAEHPLLAHPENCTCSYPWNCVVRPRPETKLVESFWGFGAIGEGRPVKKDKKRENEDVSAKEVGAVGGENDDVAEAVAAVAVAATTTKDIIAEVARSVAATVAAEVTGAIERELEREGGEAFLGISLELDWEVEWEELVRMDKRGTEVGEGSSQLVGGEVGGGQDGEVEVEVEEDEEQDEDVCEDDEYDADDDEEDDENDDVEYDDDDENTDGELSGGLEEYEAEHSTHSTLPSTAATSLAHSKARQHTTPNHPQAMDRKPRSLSDDCAEVLEQWTTEALATGR
jgi:hypothetical protein